MAVHRGRMADGKPNPVDQFVGSRVTEVRRQRRISAEALAKAIGVSTFQMRKYESGENRISVSRLYDISQALETSAGSFFEGIPADIMSPAHVAAAAKVEGAANP